MLTDAINNTYIKILKEELVPAQGCTEPVALAYCAAVARKTLGSIPKKCVVQVSGNIIKNVKSVIVPNTGGLTGISASVSAGIVAGDESAVLEVLKRIPPEKAPLIAQYMKEADITVRLACGCPNFYIDITVFGENDTARAVISNYHTNIVLVERNGEVLSKAGVVSDESMGLTDRHVLNVADIIEFADTTDLSQLEFVLKRQIAFNSAISREGLNGNWGANVGKTLLNSYGSDIRIRAKAAAAAGSDARMSGCELPVIIVSGSGNQGMAASLPVIEYARELGSGEEKLLRALIVSNLITIHQKTGIGRLSAFCGAVSAGCGAASGIAYLCGGRYEEISHTIVNALAIVSGMVCDGAKPSCAAKIAAAVDAGIFGYELFKNGNQFWGGDGIVTKGVDNTIANVGRMAREGMRETDVEILKIMVGD